MTRPGKGVRQGDGVGVDLRRGREGFLEEATPEQSLKVEQEPAVPEPQGRACRQGVSPLAKALRWAE